MELFSFFFYKMITILYLSAINHISRVTEMKWLNPDSRSEFWCKGFRLPSTFYELNYNRLVHNYRSLVKLIYPTLCIWLRVATPIQESRVRYNNQLAVSTLTVLIPFCSTWMRARIFQFQFAASFCRGLATLPALWEVSVLRF